MKLTKVGEIPNFFLDATSGIYYIRKMINGRQVWRTTGHTAYKSALRRYHEIMTELADTKAGWKKTVVPTLGEWWDSYRLAKVKADSTWAQEEMIMETHFLPEFGRAGLDELTPNQLERHFNRRRKFATKSTVSREQSLLRAILNSAVKNDLIEKNPLRGMTFLGFDSRKIVVSAEEQFKLSKVLSPTMERWLVFMLGTGLRLTECHNIVPARDINLENRFVTVTGKGHNSIPKVREVPLLDEELVRIVEEQEQETPGLATLWPENIAWFRKHLTAGCKEAGVKHITPHTLRHSFATRYLQGGGDIYVLSQILGHSSVIVTERHYAHLLRTDHAKLSAHVNLGLKRSTKLLLFPSTG